MLILEVGMNSKNPRIGPVFGIGKPRLSSVFDARLFNECARNPQPSTSSSSSSLFSSLELSDTNVHEPHIRALLGTDEPQTPNPDPHCDFLKAIPESGIPRFREWALLISPILGVGSWESMNGLERYPNRARFWG